MSTAVVSTSAAESRLFVFEDNPDHEVSCHPERSEMCAKRTSRGVEGSLPSDPRLSLITPASQLAIRPAPEMSPSGIPALDALTGGLPRGCLTEICGPASSGRTSVLLGALTAATRRGEFCALIDASDALDPHSADAAGIDLDRLLWVRCNESSPRRHPSTSLRAGSGTEKTNREKESVAKKDSDRNKTGKGTALAAEGQPWKRAEHRLDQLLRATDLLLESGGFGMIVLDIADVPMQAARRIPLTTWFRFRRAVEHKPTILLAIEQQAIAGSCSTLLLQLGVPSAQYPVSSANLSHTNLLTELQIRAELVHSRHDRKPARSITFESKTAWAG